VPQLRHKLTENTKRFLLKAKQKITEWIRRYLPQEILGTATAILGAIIAQIFTKNPIIISYAGTVGENVGFYGIAIVREIRLHRRENTSAWRIAWITFWNLVWEYGPAEFADSAVIRPSLMLASQSIMMDGMLGMLLGVLVGKVLADVLFYTIVVNFYELRKKLFGK
jgi:hypothetical protein